MGQGTVLCPTFFLTTPDALRYSGVGVIRMPRTQRKKSESGIYHVMLRGINQQQIFEDEEDCAHFLAILHECKKISGFDVFAYCLMGNHVHLLLRAGKEPLDLIFKRLGSRFVYWYNLKYQRVGHLFQDRYKSEPVETDASFLAALRYILQNPMKAGIEKAPGSYPWSSYGCYAGKSDGLTDTGMAVDLVGRREDLLAFLAEKNDDALLDINPRKPGVTEEQARALVQRLSGGQGVAAFQQFELPRRNEIITQLLHAGLSVRQISRLTGVSKSVVARCAK